MGEKHTRAGFTLIALISLSISLAISLWPLTKPGLIAGHDSGYHATRTQLFLNAFKDGQFPVRWIEGPGPGQSHPLFQFYPPGFYYLASFLTIYGALIAISIIGWLGMFLFVKKLTKSNLGALASATLFIFSPYHFSQLYVRAAYPELLATALIPWAFLGTLTNPILLAISISLMIPSHQPTLIMIGLPLLVWSIIHWKKTHLLVPPLALGLSAWFIIPLIFEQQFIRAGMLSSNYFDFHRHFASLKQLIYSPWGFGISVLGPNDGMSFQLGIINWLVVGVVILAYLSSRLSSVIPTDPPAGGEWRDLLGSKDPSTSLRSARDDIFFLTLLFSSLFLATDLSLPFWERFSLLGFVQYPWRFLSVATFATAALAGFLPFPHLSSLRGALPRSNPYRLPRRVLLAMTILGLPILFNLKYIAPSAYLPKDYFNLNNQELLKNVPNGGVEVGYLPIWVSRFPPSPQSPLYPTSSLFSIKFDSPTIIKTQTHYFPGWIAKIDGQTTIPAYNNPDGFMEVAVPAGEHQIEFKFTSTPIRKYSDYLTVFSSLILVLSLFWSKYSGATRLAPKKSPRISKAKP